MQVARRDQGGARLAGDVERSQRPLARFVMARHDTPNVELGGWSDQDQASGVLAFAGGSHGRRIAAGLKLRGSQRVEQIVELDRLAQPFNEAGFAELG